MNNQKNSIPRNTFYLLSSAMISLLVLNKDDPKDLNRWESEWQTGKNLLNTVHIPCTDPICRTQRLKFKSK